MKRKRNERGRYVAKDFKMLITFASSFIMIKYLLILFIISPWLFILMYNIELKIIYSKYYGKYIFSK